MRKVLRKNIRVGDYIYHEMMGGRSLQKVIDASPHSFMTDRGVTYFWQDDDDKDKIVRLDKSEIDLITLQS